MALRKLATSSTLQIVRSVVAGPGGAARVATLGPADPIALRPRALRRW